MVSLLLLATGALTTLHAELPEPDTIIYGTITRFGSPVTALDTDVIVEARRTSDGVVVASYRMGDSPQARDHYSLRVPAEAFSPVADLLASLPGTAFFIAASDFGGVIAEMPLTTGQRGQMYQLNLSDFPQLDSDGDGMLDEWELLHFSNLFNSPGTDTDNDGMTDGEEYVAGTNPNDPDSLFTMDLARTGGSALEVSFVALGASGPGYQSKIRRFTLESAADPGDPVWQPVPGYVDVVGAGQTLRHAISVPGLQGRFYRVAIQLTDVGPPLP